MRSARWRDRGFVSLWGANARGLRTTLYVGATGAVLANVPMALSPIRKLRSLATVEHYARVAGDGGVAAPAP
jgi:hypothetical protein